jgi:hypothetical protein
MRFSCILCIEWIPASNLWRAKMQGEKLSYDLHLRQPGDALFEIQSGDVLWERRLQDYKLCFNNTLFRIQ